MPREPTTSWGMSRQIEQRYARSLQKLRRMIMGQLRGATIPEEISRRLRVIQNRPEFVTFVESMATNMAQQVGRQTSRQWRANAQRSNRLRSDLIFQGLMSDMDNPFIGGAIRDIVLNNASLIKTIPNRLDREMTTLMAQKSAYAGLRSDDLTQEILGQFDHLLEWQARRIARTETAKAQSALTQVRSVYVGAKWYVWRTAADGERVRESHRHMEGVLVHWSEPPSPEALAGKSTVGFYHAGNIYNCRCYSQVLLDIDDVSWPHKVLYGGNIVTMQRQEFLHLYNAA